MFGAKNKKENRGILTHIDVTRIFFFVRLASERIVQICRAPVAPSGCPKAIAPPRGFNFEWSSPNTFRQ